MGEKGHNGAKGSESGSRSGSGALGADAELLAGDELQDGRPELGGQVLQEVRVRLLFGGGRRPPSDPANETLP